MSVAVRTEGNELKAGVPQAVVEMDDSESEWFDVEPSGKRILTIRRDSGGSARPTVLKFTLHWFEELKRLAPTK